MLTRKESIWLASISLAVVAITLVSGLGVQIGASARPPLSHFISSVSTSNASSGMGPAHNWTQECTPCALGNPEMAYDPAVNAVVLFGGFVEPTGKSSSIMYSNSTWEFTSGRWEQVHTAHAPSPRVGSALTYDSADGYLLLFGGNGPSGPVLKDTWAFSSGDWKRISTNPRPGISQAQMVYDTSDGYVLEVQTSNFATNVSTWTYKAGVWKNITTSPQPPASGAGIAYDPAASGVILFGGYLGGKPYWSNQTWRFSSGTWSDVSKLSAHSPRNRGEMGLTYDARLGSLLLFGGLSHTSSGNQIELSDTWAYQSGNWTNISKRPSPPALDLPNLVFDANDNYTILFGGFYFDHHPNGPSSPTGATWIYTTSGWKSLLLPLSPSPRYGASMAFIPGTHQTLLFGGESKSTIFGDTWVHYEGNWTKLSTVIAPPARWNAAMTYDAADGYVLMFGGIGPNGMLNDTWTFSSGSWTRVSTSIAPPPTAGASMAYDSTDGYVLQFGGNDGGFDGQTWTYHAGIWTNITGKTQGAPSPRYGAAMADDQKDGYVVLFGGFNGAYLADTWEFVKGNWTLISPLKSPPHRELSVFAYDSTLGQCVLFGGYDGSFLNSTWWYEGGKWTAAHPAVLPHARDLATVAFDASVGELIVFGGYDGQALWDTWDY